MTASWPQELVVAGDELSEWMGEKVSFLDVSLGFLPWHVGEVPAAIGMLQKLTKLSGQDSPYLRLPDEIGDLIGLKQFQFTGVNLGSLPETIGSWTNLHSFSATHAGLNSLPESVGDWHNVKTITLSGNRLSSLPDSFAKLEGLETVLLDKNNFGPDPSTVAPIADLKSVETINLSGNGLRALPPNFGQLRPHRLSLSRNYLDDEALELADGSLSSVRHLSLDYNRLSEIPDFVFGCQSLETLSIRFNIVSSIQGDIRDALPNLRKIRVGGNSRLRMHERLEPVVVD